MKQAVDKAIVLNRINYGEKDRVITLLGMESGKITLFAKSVRAQKSKLAAGVELLSESEITFIESKSDLKTLTSARIVRHYDKLLADQARLMFAFECLKVINKLVDDNSGQEYYFALRQVLISLNDTEQDLRLIKIWFALQLLGLAGSAPDWQANDHKTFDFDYDKQLFVVGRDDQGTFSQNDLKLLRLSSTQSKPLKLQTEAGSEDRLVVFTHNLLKMNLTEV